LLKEQATGGFFVQAACWKGGLFDATSGWMLVFFARELHFEKIGG
jgi:hypothetical protein